MATQTRGAAADEHAHGRRRPPLAAIFAITLTGITVTTMVAPVIPDILEGLDAPQAMAGVMIGAATSPGSSSRR